MLSLFPLIQAQDPAASARFYEQLLGLRAVFTADWYVQLQHPDNASVQMAFIQRRHETVPPEYQQAPAGILVTMECDDVDAVHERATAAGLPIAQELRDEAFGQRHFMTVDPDGVLVDVVQMIEPAAEFAEGYVGDSPQA